MCANCTNCLGVASTARVKRLIAVPVYQPRSEGLISLFVRKLGKRARLLRNDLWEPWPTCWDRGVEGSSKLHSTGLAFISKCEPPHLHGQNIIPIFLWQRTTRRLLGKFEVPFDG